MSNALHDYAKLFEKYSAANGGWGVILAGEDCLSLANEMMIDADALKAESTKLRELVKEMRVCLEDECKRCHEWGDACDLEHQMRDLGIEAGDGVS